MAESVNPYAPPDVNIPLHRSEEPLAGDGQVWRQGDKLVIGNRAELRPICFVTGQPAAYAIEVVHHWQPKWVYIYLLLGIVPYFIVSPMVCRKIRLKVPVSRRTYTRHRDIVHRGLIIFFAALGMALLATIFRSNALFLLACLAALPSLFMTSRPIVGLDVDSFNSNVLILRNIHPTCLAGLPSTPTSQANH